MRAAAEAAAASAVATMGEDGGTPVAAAPPPRHSYVTDENRAMQGYLKTKTDQQVLGKRLWKKYYYVLDTSQGQLMWYKNEAVRYLHAH